MPPPALADVDHRVASRPALDGYIFQLPAKESAIEILRPGQILGLQFDMYKRIAHDVSSLFVGFGRAAATGRPDQTPF
jgi:hypothetical protein